MKRKALSDRERLFWLAFMVVAMVIGGAIPDYYGHQTFRSWLYFSFIPIVAGGGVALAGFLLLVRRYKRKLLQPPQGF